MKNKLKFWGIVTLAVIISFIAGCKNLDENTENETHNSDNQKTINGTVTIGGTAKAGQTLTANTASLGGSGTISYQWKRGNSSADTNPVNIGTNSSTYTLVTADESKFIKVTVTRAGYKDSVTSEAFGPVLSAQAPTPTVTSVTLSSATASLLRGETQQFTATVIGTNNPPQSVTWSVDKPYTAGTGITADGNLTIANNETAATLTVRAESTFNNAISGTAAVTVLHPTVTNVTVGPATTNVNKGETRQFTATVTGTNNPDQAVTWTVSGGGTGTSINANGLLTVAFVETSSSLTVKATSTVDTGKSGTAAVTVKTPPLTGSISISGTAQAGHSLTANTNSLVGNGTISYQWTSSGTSGGQFTDIPGATSSTYAIVTNDVSKYIKLTVTRVGYEGSVTSSNTVGPIIAAQAPTPTVTSVTVSPATKTLLKSETQQFTATVAGTNSPAQTVSWTVTGGGTGTAIDANGLLTVSSNQAAATLTVKATSTINTNISGTATVTVPAPTVTSVTVSPATANVNKGKTQQFTATVTGTNSPAQTVNWTVTGGVAGTTINNSGILTVASNETASTLTVKATSTTDTSKSSTATVTVPALTGTVSITGTAQVGQTLTANTTSLNGSGTINYQWKRGNSSTDTNPTNIGDNLSTYSLVSADEGKYIKVTVTRSENIGSVDSNTLGAVTLPALTGSVNITGNTIAGETLTANTSGLVGTSTLNYQWTSSSSLSGAFTNISNATSSTYKLTTTDQGKYIKVNVTREGYSGTATSAATAQVTLPALTGTVSITGTAQVGQTLTANTSGLVGTSTLNYQWTSSSSSSGTFANISNATSSTYKPVAADVNKYIKVNVTREGYSGTATSAATAQITQPAEVVISTNTGSTALNGLTTPVSNYDVVDLPPDNKQNVMKVSPTDKWAIAEYSLSAYKGKEITITLSVNVKRTGKAGTLNWQINNSDYPSVATLSNAATGTWHSMSGTWTGTPSADYPSLYLNNDDKTSSGTTFYIDNFTITIKETSTGGGTGGGSTTITTTPLDKNAAGVQTFTANSNGNKALSGSSYGYEMWTEGGNNNKLIWYGPNQGGGAAFRAEWNNPNDFLGRVGYYWGNGGLFTTYKNIYADFNYTRSGRSTAGNYSYIGIYGWARNPNATKEEEKLIEYYIVEDWFGNSSQSDTSPMGTGTTGGSVVGSYTLDGATYSVIKNVRQNKPSIDGDKTFTQYFSVRQTLRKTGTISITEHFKKWEGMNMKLGNMYECKFLVEAGGGTGWLEFTYLRFSQEDSPR